MNLNWSSTLQHAKVGREVSKVLSLFLVILAFWLPTNSLWFTITVSILLGNCYYFLDTTQPQLMMILGILLRYQVTKIQSRFQNYHPLEKKKNVLEFEDNYNSLCYYDEVGQKEPKKYIYLFPNTLRSNDLIVFKNENDLDITRNIEPYLGPLQDFHGIPLTPADFNHKKITVFREGTINLYKSYEENEPINLFRD